jgi:hypothetical protein
VEISVLVRTIGVWEIRLDRGFVGTVWKAADCIVEERESPYTHKQSVAPVPVFGLG